MRLLLAASLALALALGTGCKDAAASSPVPAARGATDASPREEFLAVADKLFNTPGGKLDRTLSKVLRKQLEEPGLDPNRVVAKQRLLVRVLLHEAREQEAVTEIERVFAFLTAKAPDALRDPSLHTLRGLVYLRLSEVQNCVARHNDECCVFPIAGEGVHGDKTAAAEAARSYAAALALKPDDLTTRWLLNIMHMAMGTYPDSVPKEHLVPVDGPNSSKDFPRFRDVAKQCGIKNLNHAGGVVADDLDGDGLLDLLLSNVCPDQPMTFYRNKGDGTFEDRSADAGVDQQLGSLNIVSGDYDNDGDLDVLVLRGAWMYHEGEIRKSLLRNDGGRFTDVTRAAGIAEPKRPSQVGVFLDYDNDGDLDIFCGNEARVDPERFPADRFPNERHSCNLFRNEGDGTFKDVAAAAGVLNDRYTKGASAGDYDDDGWVDLYVSNMGKNRLYRNKGDGTFEDVAEKLGVVEPSGNSFATWFFDYDNDGHLDIYVCGYDQEIPNIGDVAAWNLRRPFQATAPRLYRNKGNGTFEDVTRTVEMWRPMAPMGANFGDLDNDGWLDMYFATGAPAYEFLAPNVMVRNVGGRHFQDVTTAGGFGKLQKGHGVAFADLDHDGDQDVFNEVGGFFQGDAFFNSLYENPGNANKWVVVKLVGKKTNRPAYGARIKVTVKTPSGERAIHRAVGSVSSFGGSPARQEIGLGDAEAIRSVEIWWPASGTRQTFTDVQPGAFYEVTEGAAAPVKLDPKRFKLGGG